MCGAGQRLWTEGGHLPHPPHVCALLPLHTHTPLSPHGECVHRMQGWPVQWRSDRCWDLVCWHRFLPDEEELTRALDRFEAHHHAFVAEFS